MADINLKRSHQLGLHGARAAADKMAEKLGEKFDLAGKWSGDTLNFTRSGVTGWLKVSESEMHLEVTLGFMLKLMKNPIEQSVHQQLDKILTEAKSAKDIPAKAPAAKVASAKAAAAQGSVPRVSAPKSSAPKSSAPKGSALKGSALKGSAQKVAAPKVAAPNTAQARTAPPKAPANKKPAAKKIPANKA